MFPKTRVFSSGNSEDELRIVTENQDAAGKVTPIGVTIGKRLK